MPRFTSLLVYLFLATFTGILYADSSPTTWYVRPDGGTRYSKNMKLGRCNGQADAPDPGRGFNQPCAFSDYRYLWDDQSYNNDEWVISGGDTVILRGGPWRVGYDAATGLGAGYTWCYGGGHTGCANPTIPSGSPSHHTRILGENYANCSSNGVTDRPKLTQIFGGFGLGSPLDLRGTEYVDVGCLEVTRHSQCIIYGNPSNPSNCSRSTPSDDFDGNGVYTDNKTSDLLLQDMWIHGHPGRGILGSIGGTVTCLRCDIAYNGAAGWDFDDGTKFAAGATWNFLYSTIEYSGCNQEYPIVHANPIISCYGQSNGGYGDGVGTPAGTGLNANVDHSSFHHNTQDGLDLGHVDTGGPYTLNISNSSAYSNSGATFKWGPNFTAATVTNNYIQADCLRLADPLPGVPANYNAHLQDFCRAFDALPLDFRNGGTALVAGNTIVSYAPTTIDVGCWDAACPNSTLIFIDNIVYGIDSPTTYNMGGQHGGPGFLYFQHPIGNVVRSNNLLFGLRQETCVATEFCGIDPAFAHMPAVSGLGTIDGVDPHLTGASRAIGAGTSIPGVTSDLEGKLRGNPPSIGAFELTGAPVGTPIAPPAPPPPPPPPTPTPTPAPAPAPAPAPDPTPAPAPAPAPAPGPAPAPITAPPPSSSAPVWFKVADEGVAVFLPAGTTIRFGKDTHYTDPITTKQKTNLYVSYTTFGDPEPYVVKELDVLEGSTPITVGVSNGTTITIPTN